MSKWIFTSTAAAIALLGLIISSACMAEDVVKTPGETAQTFVVGDPQVAIMANGDHIEFAVFGEGGPFVFLGPQLYLTSATLERSDLTKAFIAGLSDRYRVIVADWPRGNGNSSAAIGDINTAENAVDDLERIATAAGADTFAWWGYSYGGAVGLQLAARSDRLSAVVIGGYPPVWQPTSDMLNTVRRMKAQMIGKMGADADSLLAAADQSVTFYQSIATQDEGELLKNITCPRLVYHDVNDTIELGGFTHDLSKRTRAAEDELKVTGWEVQWMDTGLGHMGMGDVKANLTAFGPFLDRVLLNR